MVTGVFGLAAIAGPVLGGVIVDTLSWHWVFFVNIPLAIIVIILFALFFPGLTREKPKHRLDYSGMAALVLTVIPFMLALSLGGNAYPWLSAEIVSMLAFSVVMGVIFIRIENRSQEPVFPLSLFRNRTIAISNVVIFLAGMGLFSSIAFVPLFFKGVIGLSATTSGNFLAPMMSGMVVGTLLSGQVVGRGQYRLQGLFGLTIGALGVGLLSFVTAETNFASVIANTIMACFSIGVLLPLYATAVQNEVSYKILGIATASFAFFNSLGESLGWTVLGSAMNHRFTLEFLHGLPPETRAVISQEPLASLTSDPQLLLNPQSQEQLRELLTRTGQQGAAIYEQVLQAMRTSLNSALSEVFLVGFIFIIVALLVNLFIKNRKSNADRI